MSTNKLIYRFRDENIPFSKDTARICTLSLTTEVESEYFGTVRDTVVSIYTTCRKTPEDLEDYDNEAMLSSCLGGFHKWLDEQKELIPEDWSNVEKENE